MNYLNELIKTVEILRSPEGCEWDRQQTHQTIRQNMLEEAYEAVEAIDENNIEHLKEELGDVLLQVVLHSQIADDNKEFNIQDVAKMLNDKLIHRHPHVFGENKTTDTKEILANWEKLKSKEKQERKRILDGIPKTLPALLMAMKISKKAVRAGFEWQNYEQLLECFYSEIKEFQQAQTQEEKEDEFGDILFSLVNIARWNNIDPELALAKANMKFKKRFDKLEEMCDKSLSDLTFEEYDSLWKKAKKLTSQE
ncbi:MAG: nucleoside triphosphate pyrophosphohydrolase [Candidatus Gastranaerophilales bacterium]|nr:nucleoside triphosphate pyrophosphohydrolase [Candidatus Gastranaerophilales bacterium]